MLDRLVQWNISSTTIVWFLIFVAMVVTFKFIHIHVFVWTTVIVNYYILSVFFFHFFHTVI